MIASAYVFTDRRAAVSTVTAMLIMLAVAACDTDTMSSLSDEAYEEAITGDEFVLAGKKKTGNNLNGRLRSLLARQAPHGGISFFRLPDSHELRKIPQDPKNPLTPAKVRLGRLLYHETALASSPQQETARESYSCASCHFAQAGFEANVPQGIGEGGAGFGTDGEGRTLNPIYDSSTENHMPDVQPIRTPSSLNVAYQKLMLWNGQFGGVGDNLGTEANWTGPKASNYLGMHGLETQAHAGLVVHRMGDVAGSRVATIPRYVNLFRRAFAGDPDPVSLYNTAMAISAFERTILAHRAPFQRWLRGDRHAMTRAQYRGAILFFGKAGCSSCHIGPSLASMSFHALGMKDLDEAADPRIDLRPFGGSIPDDVRRGRGGFTGQVADDYAFKTPQLYNLVDSPFYGHGASFTSVRDVVVYLNAAIPENRHVPADRISDAFRPIGLSQAGIGDLVTFLEDALHDRQLMRYVPRSLPSGNCTPVNDPEARDDLGCEPLVSAVVASR